MRFVCDSCNAQYMISDDKVGAKGAKGVKIKCKKCGHMILVRPAGAAAPKDNGAADAPAADTAAAAVASNGASSSAAAGLPSAVGTPPSEGLFSGVEEDEIGAVFDQVLSSGPHKIPAGEPLGDAAQNSKPAAASAVQKLAEAESEPDESKAAPANDWYVAIEDRQVGPLTVDKIKEHWDRGEVGPDSLCWRAGFGDWIPLSEATELASVLAPRPAKPVIVAPAAVAPAAPAAPVESAFSAGAAAKSARAEIPAAPALGAEPTSSGWKPSAASVLASLVKEENDALSKPPPKAAPVEEKSSMGGLLDLPPEPVAAPAPRAAPMLAAMAAESMHAPQPAPMPYAPVAPAPVYAQPAPAYPQPAYAAGYPQPAYPGYPPPGVVVPQGGGNNKTMIMIGAAAVGVLLLGTVLFLALRGSNSNGTSDSTQVAVATPPPATAPKPVEPPATPPPAPNPQAAATPPPAAAGTQPAANPATPPPAVAAATPPAVTPPTPPPAAVEPKPAEPRTEQPPRVAERDPSRTPKPRIKDESVAAPSKPSKPAPDDGLDDDFDSLFKPKPSKPGSNPGATPTQYIPPEPGGGSAKVQESLAQSDIMSVVLNNKPAIVKCVNEQKKRDPDISGKLVMRWVIQTSGKTTGVSVRTDEFKKTYMASCITGLIKGWNFPKHKKQGDPIDFPFTF
jgi:predicted Zn finger-like uncharacterized protein